MLPLRVSQALAAEGRTHPVGDYVQASEQATRQSSRTSHTVPLQRAGLGEVPMRAGEDTVRALPARVTSSEVGVTVGEQRQGQGDTVLPSLERGLSRTAEGAITRGGR